MNHNGFSIKYFLNLWTALESLSLSPILYSNSYNKKDYQSLRPTPVVVTDSWLTFTNKEYKYSFRYPPDWKIFSDHNADPAYAYIVNLSDACNYDGGERCGGLQFVRRTRDEGKNLEDYYNFTFSGRWPDRIIETKNILLDEEQALSIESFDGNWGAIVDGQRGIIVQSIKAFHNDQIFSLDIYEQGQDQGSIKSSSDWENREILNQIISSFRFED